MWDYSEDVVDHFLHPRNVGEIENPDGIGEVGSLACGDMLRLTFKLGQDGKVADAKFKTFGCASAIASSSALTEMVKGKTIAEAAAITNKDIAEYLGGLPEAKMHCSVMGREALEAAIAYSRGERAIKHEIDGDVVCKCFGVTDKQIKSVARENGLTTLEQITQYTKAGGGCGQCIGEIEALLSEIKEDTRGDLNDTPYSDKAPKLTNLQVMHRTEELFNSRIRKALAHDGGDIELVDVDGGVIFVRLKGACAHCPTSTHTMRQFIEKEIQKEISKELRVEEVRS